MPPTQRTSRSPGSCLAGGKTDAQATPSYHDGLLYFPQDNKVFAIDAGTGHIVWKYDAQAAGRLGRLQRLVLHRQASRRGDLLANNVYFLSNDAKLHAIDLKTGKAKWVKSYDGFPYPKDFAKSKDSNGYCTTVGPMAIPGTIIVPMNATDTGGLEGFVLGVNPETGDMKWKAQHDSRRRAKPATTPGPKAAKPTAAPVRGSPAPTIPTSRCTTPARPTPTSGIRRTAAAARWTTSARRASSR